MDSEFTPSARPEMTTVAPSLSQPARTDFARVDTWVFDLDNTLYPAGSDLWPKIDARISLYIMQLYGLDGLSARALQKFYYTRYGTTLKGLMEADGIEPEAFLAFVHDVDRTSVVTNPALAAAVAALPGRKLIFTSGSRYHAEKTTEARGLGGLFEDVFDIVSGALVPKPEQGAYDAFLQRHGVDPHRAAMFEDIPRNLLVPKQLGMVTVLVVPAPDAIDTREAFEIAGADVPAHVDHVTADLAAFLLAAAA